MNTMKKTPRRNFRLPNCLDLRYQSQTQTAKSRSQRIALKSFALKRLFMSSLGHPQPNCLTVHPVLIGK
jgi:hypothetical protein